MTATVDDKICRRSPAGAEAQLNEWNMHSWELCVFYTGSKCWTRFSVCFCGMCVWCFFKVTRLRPDLQGQHFSVCAGVVQRVARDTQSVEASLVYMCVCVCVRGRGGGGDLASPQQPMVNSVIKTDYCLFPPGQYPA